MGKRRVHVLVADKLELAMSVPMSEYFQALDAVSKKRYLDKLSILFLSEKDDPYASSNSERFEMDMSLWPPVEFGHIFVTLSNALGCTPVSSYCSGNN